MIKCRWQEHATENFDIKNGVFVNLKKNVLKELRLLGNTFASGRQKNLLAASLHNQAVVRML